MRQTIYKDVPLTAGKSHTRTAVGKKVLKNVGECLKDGGSVQMETKYVGNCEYADIKLEWPNKCMI